MRLKDKKALLVILLGATAVGKTQLSVELAQRLNAEIISADSRLFYRGMNIGTAKPAQLEKRDIRHHLIDIADPDETISLARFIQLSRDAIADIQARSKIPLMVGGTGQYIRAISQGWKVPEVRPNEKLRAALQTWVTEIGAAELHARLESIDAEAAKNMDARNVRRVVRALEVIFTTGKKFSAQRGQQEVPYRVLQLGLIRPREELYRRIDQRITNMIADGFVEEVRGLREQGYGAELPSFSAIGYRQIARHLEGLTSLDAEIEEIKKISRVFARRQSNWFKPDDPNIVWFDADEDVTGKMAALIQKHSRA